MITVLNTNISNASSVLNALERLGVSAVLTQDPEELIQSSKVILPGVGTASALMSHLNTCELKSCIRDLTQPVLGICLGMQALYDFSEEGEGNIECLGIFRGQVQKLKPTTTMPIPHMGWNQVTHTYNSILLKGIPNDSYFYFVHSYRIPKGPEAKGFTYYGETIPAVIEHKQWFGTQFHPERSGNLGERVLKNFLEL